MRLLLTTDAVGGIWRYSMDLARGMRARGVDAVLGVLGPPPTGAQREEARGLELVETGQPLDWTAEDARVLARASGRLAGLAGLLGVDGVHLHAPALVGDAAWPAPVVAVAHSCVGTWWQAMRAGPPPADFAWRIAATGRGLGRAAAVIAPSAAHATATLAVYGPEAAGGRGITVVHNGAGAPAAGGARERAVLTAGRLWDEAKGVDGIDAAAAGLGEPVRAAGPLRGPNGAAIELRHVQHLGTLDAAGMARAYAEASVFVSMARYEPFGLSVLEAALAGMRLVLADIPTFRELWDGVADFAEPGTLGQALRTALDGGPAAPDTAARAARFTIDRMVDGTLAVHRRVAGAPELAGVLH